MRSRHAAAMRAVAPEREKRPQALGSALRQGAAIPPAIADLVAWAVLFRRGATCANSCGHVRVGCLLA
eukprot:4700437-Pyramimonas_sp.AAC.1